MATRDEKRKSEPKALRNTKNQVWETVISMQIQQERENKNQGNKAINEGWLMIGKIGLN